MVVADAHQPPQRGERRGIFRCGYLMKLLNNADERIGSRDEGFQKTLGPSLGRLSRVSVEAVTGGGWGVACDMKTLSRGLRCWSSTIHTIHTIHTTVFRD